MRKKILITGSQGMLGKDMIGLFSVDTNYDVFGIARKGKPQKNVFYGDLTDQKFLNDVLKEINPSLIINCAANVNVDSCENNKMEAYKLHVGVSKQLASYEGAKFIYISSDSVFDGQKGNYTETSTPNPLNYYAETKLLGEKISLESNKKTIVVRTNIYGFKFPEGRSLVEWAIGELKENHPIIGFEDVSFNPLYTKQLSKVVKFLAEEDCAGIINAASTSVLSKYEFLLKLSEVFHFDNKLITKGSISNSPLKTIRPNNTVLNINRLSSLYEGNLSIEEGLIELKDDYIKEERS